MKMSKADKKTAIVSCYFQPNYGSMLQAYATQMALDRLGRENETIRIDGLNREIRRRKLLYFTKAALTSDILLSKAGMAASRIRRRIPGNEYADMIRVRRETFQAFTDRFFRLTVPYPSLKDLREACEENYDAVLVGSDQLWLPANIAADYYTLSFVPEQINTIAYSTSFGQAELPRGSRRAAARFLSRIRHIGVRERAGQQLIRRLCGRRVPVVLDPTLLFTGKEWTGIQEEAPIAEGSYIFCYFLGSNARHRRFASRLSEVTGCRIVALTHLDEYVRSDCGYADETPWEIDPSGFLNLIRHAAWVCTDSYHCTGFSILYERNFFTFRRYSRKTLQSTNSRLDTLLEQCGLSDRLLTGEEDPSDWLAPVSGYEKVHSGLEKLRRYSWNYLVRSLEDQTDTDLSAGTGRAD